MGALALGECAGVLSSMDFTLGGNNVSMKFILVALLILGLGTALLPLPPAGRIVVGLAVVALAIAGLVIQRGALARLD